MSHNVGPCERCEQWAPRAYYPMRPTRLLICATCWHTQVVGLPSFNDHAFPSAQQPIQPWPAAAFRAIAQDIVLELAHAIENGDDLSGAELVDRLTQEWYPQAKAALQALQAEPLLVTCERSGCGLVRPASVAQCRCQAACGPIVVQYFSTRQEADTAWRAEVGRRIVDCKHAFNVSNVYSKGTMWCYDVEC